MEPGSIFNAEPENRAQDLAGQVAIITGGSTEVAAAVALALARQGVRICLCGKQADALALVVGWVRVDGGECLPVQSELDTLEAAQAIVEQTRLAFGRLDILILMSPFWAGGFIHSHSVKAWDLVMAANLREPFLMARAALPVMREQKRGQVLAIASDSASTIYPQDGAFGVALHGLAALMELIRAENRECGIRTHTLSPGLALTSGLDASGLPALSPTDVADWAVWLLTRPAHLPGGMVNFP